MAEENLLAGKEVPIAWIVPDDLVTRYATNIVVQHSEHEFFLSFFEADPPIILGSREEALATIEQLGSLKAKCVARIVVAPKRMREFVRVLQANLEKYLEAEAEGEE